MTMPSPARGQEAVVLDPVCGMTVDPRASPHRLSYRGRTYHFCSAGCQTKFAADPAKYLGPDNLGSDDGGAHEHPGEAAIYTCPMHPQIRQVGPGNCPICGMALEPVLAVAETGPNPELVDMTRRFRIGLALAVPVVVLEMGGHLIDLHGWLGQQASNWLQLAFATPVVLWAGWPFFLRGWQSVVTRNLNMFTLIAMGTGVAWGESVRDALPLSPRHFAADGAVAVFRPRRSSPSWSCWARCWAAGAQQTSGAIALRSAPKTARRPPTAAMRMFRSIGHAGRSAARASGEGAGRRQRSRG